MSIVLTHQIRLTPHFFVLLLVILLGTSTLNTHAQEQPSAFNRVYIDIATNSKATDIDSALLRADSLYQNSLNNFQKIKSTLLLALLFEYKGELADAIYWATKSQDLAINDKNYEFQVRSSGYLATLYRRIDLTTESNIHILKAEKANAHRKLEPNYPIIQSTIYHEKALHSIENKNYIQALSELDKSVAYIHELDNISHLSFVLAAVYETYVDCYLQTEEYEKARIKCEKGLEFDLENYPELVSLLYSYIAVIEMYDNNFEKAYQHLNVARELTEKQTNLAVQIKVYEALYQYYLETQDTENALLYSNKVAEVNNKRTKNIKKVSNELLVKMHTSKNKMKSENKTLFWLINVLVFIILVALIVSRLIVNKQRKKYKQLLNRLKDSPKFPTEPADFQKEKDKNLSKKSCIYLDSENPDDNKSIMTPETEKRLLEDLNLLESKKFYLDSDITLSALTVELNSNTRYVSYIIKTYKNNDFNNYINELRVFYIVELMKSEPKYLKYKLSYIAEITGFSSHSKFTTMFKKVTGMTPSAFINEVKKESKVKNSQ